MKKTNTSIAFIIITILLFASLLLFLNLTDPNDYQITPRVTDRALDITMISCDLPSFLLERIKEEILEDSSYNINLKSNTYPDNIYYNTLNATLHSEIGPDIIMIEHPAVLNSLIPTSELLPLNNYINDSWRTQLNIYSINNSFYCSPPLGIRTYKVYYNKSIINKWGYDLDEISMDNLILTLDELKTRGTIPIAFGIRDWKCLKNILIQLNLDSNTKDPWHSSVDRLKAIQPYLMPKSQLYDYEDAKLSFKNGDTLIFFGIDMELPELLQDCNFEVGEMHILKGNSYTVWCDYIGMYAINKNTPNKKEALSIIKKLSGQEMLISYRTYMDSINLYNSSTERSAQYSDNWFFNNNGVHLLEYISRLERLRHELAD